MMSTPRKFCINYPKRIENFMKDQDLPKWYRGLSKFQLEAASALHLNLRDDMQQETTHRTQCCLMRLGLEPPVNQKKIKLVMKLSKGQDLAFLWFLMSIYYKGACRDCAHPVDVYNINEQICFSAIAHLDLIPTLRELDIRLPKQPSQPRKGARKVQEKKNSKKNQHVSPYCQKLVKPIEQKRRPFYKGTNIIPNFSEYTLYTDAYYQCPNEKNRWYSTYICNPKGRFLDKFVNETIDQIFDSILAGGDLNELLSTRYKDTFCKIHKGGDAMKGLHKAEAIVKAYNQLDAHLDGSRVKKEQSIKRTDRDLDSKVEEIRRNNPGCHRAPKIIPLSPFKQSVSKNTNSTMFSLYFKAPTHHSPYIFNFPMIFKDIVSNSRSLKDSVSKAMNIHRDMDEDKAVQMVCKEMWYTTVAETKKAMELQVEKQKKEKKKVAKDPLDKYRNLEYYDPRDSDLMSEMLQEAIADIRKDTKFVLSSLPDVHKLPILREWIRVRYGFSYTPQEIALSVKQSQIVFKNMKRVTFKKPFPPSVRDFSLKQVITFACQPQLRERYAKVYATYSHDVKYIIMDMARIYWEAMKPYQCPMGPPRGTFFAYAPGNMENILMKPN